MEPDQDLRPRHIKTFWMYVREGLKEAHARRPISFYLLLAIPAVLLLGLNLLTPDSTPKRFGFYLGLFFIFFGAILLRATIDFIEIARKHFSDSHKLFQATLGDREFVERLGERVNDRNK